MTNREWLNTLSNEDFAKWAAEPNVDPFELKKVKGKFVVDKINDPLYPRLRQILLESTYSFYSLIEWLSKERFDRSKAELEVDE